jgi:hypothetical protein
LPITKPLTTTPFHQKLATQDCVACHSDHAGVKRFRQQGRFNHALLKKDTLQQCQACHKAPADSLHQQISGNCSQCHNQEKWLPASFDHSKYFVLDRDHNARCVTCHLGNDYSRYTCYGCHEHSLAKSVASISRKAFVISTIASSVTEAPTSMTSEAAAANETARRTGNAVARITMTMTDLVVPVPSRHERLSACWPTSS